MYRNTSTPADDNGCGWFHLSPPRTPRPAHSGRSQARWAVLGAGFTGLAAARQHVERIGNVITAGADVIVIGQAVLQVLQGLDDHIRAVVTQAMQTQQLLLVQSLRGQLAPVVEALVRDAVAGETAQAARQNGDGCIQTTD